MESGVGALSTCADFNICTYAGAAGDTEADLRRLEATTGIARERMYLPVQTHSARVVTVPASAEELQGADGVVARGRGVLVGVHTADCLPLLMVDRAAEVIAAVHCGWRGTVAGIAERAVSAMEGLGANAARIEAIIGPHICAECFEVGEEVACLFSDEAVIRREGMARPHVSLARAVELQLQARGVRRIERSGFCSMEDARFLSVRRQGRDMPRRTLSAIWLRN